MIRRYWRLLAVLAGIACAGCNREPASPAPLMATVDSQDELAGGTATDVPNHGAHKTAHGGVLNAICKCEIGHAEVKLEGNALNVWFVGGAPDTTKAVPIPDRSISLQIEMPDKTVKSLMLTPDPLDLAGEKVGSCSRFEGKADWLNGVGKFTATACVRFKGQTQPLRIEYPNGYDPD